MNVELTRLGVPPELQAFLQAGDKLCFDYGDAKETYNSGAHRVPATRNVWFAGDRNASTVVISYSAMEIMAYLTLNRQRHPDLDSVALAAFGNRVTQGQVNWVRQQLPRRRVILVFGRDLLGRITDIKVAAGLKNIRLRIYYNDGRILIEGHGKMESFDQDTLSLNSFKLRFGLRGAVSTRKPVRAATFLDQLQTAAGPNHI